MRADNLELLDETLRIMEHGEYVVEGKTVSLCLSPERMRAAQVLLPQEVNEIINRTDFQRVITLGRLGCGCENMDSFALAQKRYTDCAHMFAGKDAKPVLVLNMANPVNPGGGVRRGAQAQEEDLCRKSSLLLSLESEAAQRYYEYNRSLKTYMGSDAMIFTPEVEIIRDECGALLPETVIVSVLTCAAPMITMGQEGMSEKAYCEMFSQRITSMLKCAAYFGYKVLILGAWGCGAFGNDASLVSDLFYHALKELQYNGMGAKDLFRRIDFAVLCRSKEQYNYKQFARYFADGNFYQEEDREEIDAALKKRAETEIHLDQIRGCIIGGAVGDALGYAVEFSGEQEIFSKYGSDGIRSYAIDDKSGKALISDDTQMSLFTANGLLVGDTRGQLRGIQGPPHTYVRNAYFDWLRTQEMSYENSRLYKGQTFSWLCDVPELYHRRAPGVTCLSALNQGKQMAENDSKGCGGIMRVAPLALNYHGKSIDELDKEGAAIAGLTHGHSLGQMPAAVLTHIINRIVFPEKQQSLWEIIIEARDEIQKLYDGDEHLQELERVHIRACKLNIRAVK